MTRFLPSGSKLTDAISLFPNPHDVNFKRYRSDGTQPHYVNIQFLKKMRVQEISMYLDFKTDESYTP